MSKRLDQLGSIIIRAKEVISAFVYLLVVVGMLIILMLVCTGVLRVGPGPACDPKAPHLTVTVDFSTWPPTITTCPL